MAFRVVIAGNPGVGKSTILNSLIGSAHFRSGISIGEGLTQRVHTHIVNGVEYVDTPGLDDISLREKACRELSSALTYGGDLKLIFVCTLEAGHVKPADLATVDAVVGALESAGANMMQAFSFIVNKCDSSEMRALEDEGDRALIARKLGRRWGVPHITFLPIFSHARGAENVLLGAAEEYRRFVQLAPTSKIRYNATVQVDMCDFEAKKQQLEDAIYLTRKKIAEATRRNVEQRRKTVAVLGVGAFIIAAFAIWNFGFAQ